MWTPARKSLCFPSCVRSESEQDRSLGDETGGSRIDNTRRAKDGFSRALASQLPTPASLSRPDLYRPVVKRRREYRPAPVERQAVDEVLRRQDEELLTGDEVPEPDR